jgi:hypothetical protein
VVPSVNTTFIPCRVTPGKASGVRTNPTTVPVFMAFMQDGGEPGAGDWNDAIWDTDNTGSEPIYEARCLIGPAAPVALTDGSYRVWVKVADSPEVVVIPAGRLVVT